MQNKVLLIRPENVYHYNNYPSLGLICLASKLKEKNYEVKIINCALENDYLKSIEKELDGVLMIVITLLTSEIPGAYIIMKYLKEKYDIPIVSGGWHCTLFPEQMAAYEYIDYTVAGEGEDCVVQIADALRAGVKISDRIFPKKMLDMEKLVFPEYSLDSKIEHFINSSLTDKLSVFLKSNARWLPYESSRGCPSLCTFCVNVVSNNTSYRKKSAAKVNFEIEEIVKKYRISHLKIIDDNFFVDIERVRKICNGIIDKKLDITWDAECRCDYFNNHILNDETLRLAKESGLVQLTLGIESGSPRTLKRMKKNITTQQAEFAVKKCDEYGIISRSSFILEIPGETKDDIRMTVDFINRLRKYSFFTCGVNTFRPYPRCELTQGLLKSGYLKEPCNFEGWVDRGVIDLYTAAEFKRPWQVDGEYSESAAYYLSMESSVRLGNHQINIVVLRLINNCFILLAKLRNRLKLYGFPVEKKLYKIFLTSFYNRRQDKNK